MLGDAAYRTLAALHDGPLHGYAVAERLLRLAVRAYPADYRAARGEELVATSLELSSGSVDRRELGSLLAGGMHERGRRATGATASGAWAEGCRLAALVLLLVTAG